MKMRMWYENMIIQVILKTSKEVKAQENWSDVDH